MKKIMLVAALLLLLAPVSVMAGMTTASELDLEGVTGQTGLTIDMTMTVTATDVAWGDNDGFASYESDGWLILRGVTLPSITLNNVVIDVGGDGTTSYLAIATGAGNIIAGNLTVQSIVVGSSATANTESLGELRVNGIGVSFGTIRIAGHAAP